MLDAAVGVCVYEWAMQWMVQTVIYEMRTQSTYSCWYPVIVLFSFVQTFKEITLLSTQFLSLILLRDEIQECVSVNVILNKQRAMKINLIGLQINLMKLNKHFWI